LKVEVKKFFICEVDKKTRIVKKIQFVFEIFALGGRRSTFEVFVHLFLADVNFRPY